MFVNPQHHFFACKVVHLPHGSQVVRLTGVSAQTAQCYNHTPDAAVKFHRIFFHSCFFKQWW